MFPTIEITVLYPDSEETIQRYTAFRKTAGYRAPFRLVLCGHSLGAAVASVLTSIWLATNSFGPYKVVCFGYCPPCVFSMPLARHPLFLKSIYSVVVGHDVVSRLCIGSAWELRALIMNLQKMKREQPNEYKQILDIINGVESQEDKKMILKILLEELDSGDLPRRKMFPAGRSFHIPSGVVVQPEQQEGLMIEFDANCLSSISMHPAMLSDHISVFQMISQNNNL